MRGTESRVLLLSVLRKRLEKHQFIFKGHTYTLSSAGIDQVIGEISSTYNSGGLLAANKTIYGHLINGIAVTEFLNGSKASITVPLIDWTNENNNTFHVTEEFSVTRQDSLGRYRTDIVGFVNGIPLTVIEAKRPISLNSSIAMVDEGISQHLRNQMNGGIQDLYAYSQLLFSVSAFNGKYATTDTPKKFWSIWREGEISDSEMKIIRNQPIPHTQKSALFANRLPSVIQEYEALHAAPIELTEQDRLIIGLLRPDRLLDMTKRFIFFDHKKGKIVARYQQVDGTKSIIRRVSKLKQDGRRKGGVIWHTTGSGKSSLMILLTKALLLDPKLVDFRIIIVTDRIDLQRQLATSFMTGGAFGSTVATLGNRDSAMAQSGQDLAKRIGQSNDRIIFTLLQKFNSATSLPVCHNSSSKILVLVDEGHRSQDGENHERMRSALPNAAFIAFTGTPLLKENKTQSKFGPILHAYTMQRAIEDGAVTPLLYEERKPAVDINDKAIDAWFDKITAGLSDMQKADLKKKYSTKRKIYGASNRIELIAWDIAEHFNRNFKAHGLGLKGQLATDSRLSAIRYKEALNATGLVSSDVVISAPDTREGHDDTNDTKLPEVQKWWNDNVGSDEERYEKKVIEDFGTDGNPDILIVVDKLLTGFDEPRNAVLYIDKNLKSHNLLQAIARVNRLHEAKQHGLLIDYRGILAELDTTIQDYQDLATRTQAGFEIEDLTGMVANISTEYKRLPALHDALWEIFCEVQNTKDIEQFRQVLIPSLREDSNGRTIDDRQKVREDFYEALTEFGMCMKLALSSRSFFEDGSFKEDRIQTYKDDLKFFIQLRVQAKQDAQETVDFTVYEDQIHRLVDKQVIGQDITDSCGIILVTQLGESKNSEDWSEKKIRNEADVIKTRMRRTIKQELGDDPHAQRVFSEMLKDAIKQAEALFDHPNLQYSLFKDLEERIQNRILPDVPDYFQNRPHAQAYFGVFLDQFGSQIGRVSTNDLVRESVWIDDTVNDAMRRHSINPSNMEAEITRAMLIRYHNHKFFDELDVVKDVIKRVLDIVRIRNSRENI